MRAALVLAILLALGSIAEAKITCSSLAKRESGWNWRLIDGKRCWYRASRRIAKTQLTWVKQERKAHSPEKEEPPPNVRVLDVKKVDEMPAALDFNSRWWGERTP